MFEFKDGSSSLSTIKHFSLLFTNCSADSLHEKTASTLEIKTFCNKTTYTFILFLNQIFKLGYS